MKAKLEFDLEDPQQAQMHRDCLDGSDWKEVVTRLNNQLRDMIKHGHRNDSDCNAFQEVRHLIQVYCESRRLVL